ncbi:YhcN/YlaJ family sporulation lipoprotein [Paraliobacillus sediminis]|uniref:YhcN/YlaJ family sporulation lipoprotein n=1 Tax=Paraliobacillus sediminis TaxID=1885916 RepID=UPI000E3CE3FE|nr:YhcN/YlaJ family sporulation lipoprotein [Paraliobacillus sediminis]
MKFTMIFLSIFFILAGCQGKEENLANQGNEDHVLHVKDSEASQDNNGSNQEIAKHLASLANNVPDVNDATAIIAGPYAVVGIDVNKEIDRTRVGSIKYAVTEALHDDPYGKTAMVIADADATERIKAMARSVQTGNPVSGVIEELSAIVGRYMPELPPENANKGEEDANKKSIPENEEKELEKIQEEQSNNHLNQKE